MFSKKPGGTFFGNLLRGAVNKASGGMLGTGANRIELGQTKTNAQLAQESADLQAQISRQQQELASRAGGAIGDSALLNANPTLVNKGIGGAVGWIVGGLALLLVLFKDKLFKKKF
ncbi:hypothetical protein [Pedobacter jeongneungensis]|uniref:hypothetical protein n=1 Tax=Pedobacter jeongneungensis TaxID=947309 RepID=UPI0013B39B5D|nr:hypothetical protein [Pedobacter jeongneungensis]